MPVTLLMPYVQASIFVLLRYAPALAFSSSHLRRCRRAGRSRRVGVAVFAGRGRGFNTEETEETKENGERGGFNADEDEGENAATSGAVAVFAGIVEIADAAGTFIAVFAGIADSRRESGAGARVGAGVGSGSGLIAWGRA